MLEMTREPQYQCQVKLRETKGLTTLGLVTNQVYHDDPRRLVFLLARYKFVSKMLSGKRKVLEVGCGDAFGTRIVLQEVGAVHAVDFDPTFVHDVHQRMEHRWRFVCTPHDMVADGPVPGGPFDGAYSLDVLEHISREQEGIFLGNMVRSLTDHGVLIIGSPSLQSQSYASPPSKEGHINCKDGKELKQVLGRFFHNVFLFSMNDEVVHTGFYPMAHYLFAVCSDRKE
jgi:cyclopropane fatty-acyl-phospholipid synthase-like methyltransferase